MKKNIYLLLLTCLIGITAFSQNLLINADASDGFNGWTIIASGGSGWRCNENMGWQTSYNQCTMSQTIDLTKYYSEAELDGGIKVFSDLNISYPHGGQNTTVKVECKDASGVVLLTNTFVSVTNKSLTGEYYYSSTSICPVGTRQITLTFSGKDGVYWSGYYGPIFYNPSVCLGQYFSPTNIEITNMTESTTTVTYN